MKNFIPYIYKNIDHHSGGQYNTSILIQLYPSISHKDLSQSRSFGISDQKHASFYHEEAKRLAFLLPHRIICLDTTYNTHDHERQNGLTYFVNNVVNAYQKLFGTKKTIAQSLLLSEYHYSLFKKQTDYFL